ncbi:class I SAM-dependent methyltransferase [soil metagenome]
MLLPKHDPMGRAMLDYLQQPDESANIIVHCDIADDDVIPVPLLFRNWDGMSPLEQTALENCYGRVLDLGAGAGSHALELQKRGLEVVAADISPGSVEVMKTRGVADVRATDISGLGEERFDTILLMMNGIGLTGTLESFKQWLQSVKPLLLPGGQIIFDTSDIEYLYMDDEGNSFLPDDGRYYGEVQYQMQYKDTSSTQFAWLFIDSITLTDLAFDGGFDVELLDTGDNFTYLVRLVRV